MIRNHTHRTPGGALRTLCLNTAIATIAVAAVAPVVLFAMRPISAAAMTVTAARPGEIPFGEWEGEGTFVYDMEEGAESPVEEATRELVHDLTGLPPDEVPLEKSDDKDRPPKRKTVDRRYRTEMTIERMELDGREIVLLLIRSRRGPLPDLDNETRLMVALEKLKDESRAASVYRVAGLAFNPPAGATPELQDLSAATGCTCITRGDVTVLQIRYMDNFVDTFRFEDDKVEKTGVFGSKSGLIHWVEELEER